MDIPKPHPPRTTIQQPIGSMTGKPRIQVVQEKTQPAEPVKKPPFVRKPHLTDRPFRDLKTQLDTK